MDRADVASNEGVAGGASSGAVGGASSGAGTSGPRLADTLTSSSRPCISPSSVAVEQGAHRSMLAFGARKLSKLAGHTEVYLPKFAYDTAIGLGVQEAHRRAEEAMINLALPWSMLLDDGTFADLVVLASKFYGHATTGEKGGSVKPPIDFAVIQAAYLVYIVSHINSRAVLVDRRSLIGGGNIPIVRVAQIAVRMSLLGIEARVPTSPARRKGKTPHDAFHGQIKSNGKILDFSAGFWTGPHDSRSIVAVLSGTC